MYDYSVPHEMGKAPTIPDDLEAFRRHVSSFREVVNQEGVWLFLASLGCWSVSQPWLMLLAIGIALGLFGILAIRKINERRSFGKIRKDIEQRIFSEVADEIQRKAFLYDLYCLRRKFLSLPSACWHGMPFLLGWTFFGVTLIYAFSRVL